MPAAVTLAEIDDELLEELLAVARQELSPRDVMAPLPGDPAWGPVADDAFRRMHRDAQFGLTGPRREITFAVTADQRLTGSLRLFHPGAETDVLEVGVWLSRFVRSRGIGTACLSLAVPRARELGASVLTADTSATNTAALTTLLRNGFSLEQATPAGRVHASLLL